MELGCNSGSISFVCDWISADSAARHCTQLGIPLFFVVSSLFVADGCSRMSTKGYFMIDPPKATLGQNCVALFWLILLIFWQVHGILQRLVVALAHFCMVKGHRGMVKDVPPLEPLPASIMVKDEPVV